MEEKLYEYKYKPGDAVRVRADLNMEDMYKMMSGKYAYRTTNCANREMCAMSGGVVHILNYTLGGQYKVKEDRNFCNWTDEMFEDQNRIFHGLI